MLEQPTLDTRGGLSLIANDTPHEQPLLEWARTHLREWLYRIAPGQAYCSACFQHAAGWRLDSYKQTLRVLHELRTRANELELEGRADEAADVRAKVPDSDIERIEGELEELKRAAAVDTPATWWLETDEASNGLCDQHVRTLTMRARKSRPTLATSIRTRGRR
jgi:hypothetical protein